MASDQRAAVRQLGATLLHNVALREGAEGDTLSDNLMQVVCALSEELADDKDGETARRRLLGVGVVVKRAGAKAAELLQALGALDAMRSITTNGRFKAPVRALAAEVLAIVDTLLAAAAAEGDSDVD